MLWWLDLHLHIQSISIIIKVGSSIPVMPRCTQYNFMLWGLSEWCISLDTVVSPTKAKMIPRILLKWCCGWFYISITISPIVRLCSVILPIYILLYYDFIFNMYTIILFLSPRSSVYNSNLSAISWRDQFNFQWNDDEVRFLLDQHA